MRILEGGCRVFFPEDGEAVTEVDRTCRTPICKGSGASLLAQSVSEYGLGRPRSRVNPRAEEVLYVVSGKGSCSIGEFDYDLERGVGAYVPAGAPYRIANTGPGCLVIVGVCCPGDHEVRIVEDAPQRPRLSSGPPRRTVREQDRPPIPVADRQFKLMVDKDLGCRQITQFVGFIPPSKAPFHYHPYEEAIYILEGSGIVHAESESLQFVPGTSIYLPVGVRHCIENPGRIPLQLLGVFYPSGSPAAAYEE